MKKIILLLTVFIGLCYPQSYLLFEDWEGVGINGWAKAGGGTVDYDNTFPALEGSENFYCGDAVLLKKAFSDTSNLDTWTFFIHRTTDVTAGGNYYLIRFYDADDAQISFVFSVTDGRLRLYSGAYSGFSATTLKNNTNYYIWVRSRRGTGLDGQFDLYISETPTRSETPDITWTGAHHTRNFAKISLNSSGTANNYFDYIVVDSVEIEAPVNIVNKYWPIWPEWPVYPEN